MNKDIVLFYYYSSYSTANGCWLNLSKDIALRNMFLRPCGSVIHFEFPTFEDHSYNSICNGKGLKSLIKRESGNDKYIIFRTKDRDTDINCIIGYYKLGKMYYQETSLFNNNGFIWGIKASPAYLIKKGIIECKYSGRNYVASWNSKKWGERLNNLIERIEEEENVSNLYQSETNKLISIFKNKNKINEWRNMCKSCEEKKDCKIYKCFKRYGNKQNSDMFSVINYIYTSNIYSRNVINDVEKYSKKYLNISNGG